MTTKNGKRKRSARGMGRLFKKQGQKQFPADSKAAGSFYLTYTVEGQRITTSLRDRDGNPITDKEQAEAARRIILAPYMTGNKVESLKAIQATLQDAEATLAEAEDKATPPLTIADGEQAYLASPSKPDSGERTEAGYLGQWNRFSEWAGKNDLRYMRDVGLDQVKAYVADLNTENYSPSTFNQHIKTLVRFWRVLAHEARVSVNPWTGVNLKTLDKIERRKRALTIEEASKVIKKTPEGDLKDLLLMIACTGQRYGDICTLKWSSVDLDAGIIELVPRKTRRRKGEPVFIPILPQAREVLERRTRKGSYVFPELHAAYQRDNSAISKQIQKRFTETKLVTTRTNGTGRAIVEVGAHSLRHTFNTIARWAGLPDALIRKITGHTSARMTDHYTQFDKAMVSRLSASFHALPTGNGNALALPEHDREQREPLPPWATELVQKMNGKNWRKVRDELMGVAL
ncbi:MAG: site-specific integrase [Verrucomicrobia bacterium]|nr:site-specific integrase [Verrucomicrobiota bacterium]